MPYGSSSPELWPVESPLSSKSQWLYVAIQFSAFSLNDSHEWVMLFYCQTLGQGVGMYVQI